MSSGTLLRSAGRRAPAPRIDPRMAQRRDDVRASAARRRRRRLLALVVVTVVVLAAVGVTRSPLLDVDHVRAVGATRSGPDAARAAASVEIGDPMTSIDLSGAERRIERLPWVADATVTRDWPGTVRIKVIERVAVATTDGPRPLLVDRTGRLLGSGAGRDDLASVGSIPDHLHPGDTLPADGLDRLAVITALPAALAGEVATITTGADGIELVLTDGVVVVVGDAGRLREKFDVVTARLARPDRDTIETLNVTVPAAAALTRRPSGGA